MKMTLARLRKDHPEWTWTRTQMREGYSRYRGKRTRDGEVERASVFPLGDDWMVDYTKTMGTIDITGRPEEYVEWTDYIRTKCPRAYDTPFDAMKDADGRIKRGVEARKCEECGDWHAYENKETLGE